MADQSGASDNLIKQAGSINLNDLSPDLAVKQSNDFKNFYNGQNTDINTYLSKLYNFSNSQPTTQGLSDRIAGQLNLPALRASAGQLNQTLYQLPATYSAATTGHNVNANQLAQIVGTKQAQLAPAAALATQNVQAAEGQLTQRLGYENQDYQNRLDSYKTEGSLMNDKLARESTGFGQLQQNELDALVAKVQAGVTLTQGERDRANALAIAEKQYQAAKYSADKQLEAAKLNPLGL